MTKSIRHLHLVGATGQIRTAVYNGSEHIVVPVVAMVEGVVWAVNSEYPELVTAEVLAETPQQWNGRACFAGHPDINGQKVTANTPKTLEKSFGVIFDTATAERILTTRRLEFECYLDPVKAKHVGPKAESVISRFNAGKTVEVSVGCFVTPDETDGVFEDKPYVGAWQDIVSDHVAFLEEGEAGACSVAAGCGAPRAAVRHLITAEGIRREESDMPETAVRHLITAVGTGGNKPDPPAKRSLRERFLGLLSSQYRAEEGTSDIDLRRKLDAALHALEPGYMGIDSVFPDDKLVIYSVMPKDEWKTMRRSFTLDAKGEVKVADKAEEVEPVTTYEPVTAATAAKPCSCGRQQAREAQTPPTTGVKVMKDTVKKVIDESGGKYTEADATWMEAIPDAHLASLAVAKPAAAAPAPVAAAASTKTMTDDEVLAVASPELKALITKTREEAAAKKTELIEQLKTAQSEYKEDELKAMSTIQLERIARLTKTELRDYSGQAPSRTLASDPKDVYANPPDGYAIAIENARKARTIQ